MLRAHTNTMIAIALLRQRCQAGPQDKVIHIGFQKYGKLVLLKSKGTLDEKPSASWSCGQKSPPARSLRL